MYKAFRRRFSLRCIVLVIVLIVVNLLLVILRDHTVTTSDHAQSPQTYNDKSDILYDEGDISESECIDANICPLTVENGHIIYKYTRQYSFYHNLNKPVNYDVNVTNSHDVIPRIVHFVWIRNSESRRFEFFQLLSMIAAQRHIRPERIYVWHDHPPEGPYWNQALKVITNMYLVRREKLQHIYGKIVYAPIHVSDIVRMEALMEYGGIYLDFDSFVVNPVDALLKYDAVFGHEEWYILANGMMFSKAWADFFRIWYPRYATFENSFQTHSNIIPNIISLRQPNLVHIEESSLCKPNYKMRRYLFDEGNLWNWRKDNYVIHFYVHAYRDAGYVDLDPENIKYMNTTIGEVARYIYYGDGKLWGIRPLPLRNETASYEQMVS